MGLFRVLVPAVLSLLDNIDSSVDLDEEIRIAADVAELYLKDRERAADVIMIYYEMAARLEATKK